MTRLPVVSARDLVKAFQKDGFEFIRQRGSHMILQKHIKGTTLTIVIPAHKEIASGTLRSILKKAEWTPAGLVKLLSLLAISVRYW